jgi:hypothetical protein
VEHGRGVPRGDLSARKYAAASTSRGSARAKQRSDLVWRGRLCARCLRYCSKLDCSKSLQPSALASPLIPRPLPLTRTLFHNHILLEQFSSSWIIPASIARLD